MQILGKLFTIVLFTGMVGSMFAVLMLFLQKALTFVLPVWAGMLGAAFYLVPVVMPQLHLISPEEVIWIAGYETASVVWIAGAAAGTGYYLLRVMCAYRAVRSYSLCQEERLLAIYAGCAAGLNIRRLPPLLFGSLKDPACVVTLLRPVVILNEEIILPLSDQELKIVLSHELMHVKRKHHWISGVYDVVSAICWFNPLVWIARQAFSHMCEMDCDKHALRSLAPEAAAKEYTAAMFHLMEKASAAGSKHLGGIGALTFPAVKQRFVNILQQPSKRRSLVLIGLVSLCVALTVWFSVSVSRGMFYPYPLYSHENYEYADTAK